MSNIMMRVIEDRPSGTETLGTIEAPEVPAVGDGFFWKTHGPFKVTKRTWQFPKEFQSDRPHLVILTVTKISADAQR